VLETRTIEPPPRSISEGIAAREPEGPRQVHVERLLPVLVVDVRGGPAEPQSRVRDHDVEASEGVHRRREDSADVLVVRRVASDGAPTDLGRHGLDGLGSAAGDDHLRALAREQPSGRGADPGSPAADDRHPAVESPHTRLRVMRHSLPLGPAGRTGVVASAAGEPCLGA
jgi:hypothetical protein